MILCSIFLFLLLHIIIKMLFSCCKTPYLSISKIFLLLGQTKNKKNYIQQSAEYLHLIFHSSVILLTSQNCQWNIS